MFCGKVNENNNLEVKSGVFFRFCVDCKWQIENCMCCILIEELYN